MLCLSKGGVCLYKLFGFLLQDGKGFVFSSSCIYLFSQCGPIYFILLVLIHTSIIVFFCYFVFEYLFFFFKYFLVLQDALTSSCIFPASVLESALSPKSLSF